MKLYIKEQNSYPDKDLQDWIKRCFERNNIPMNLLNHVVEENRGLYIDTDLTDAEQFNNNYGDEWRLKAVTIESPYYDDYHFELYHMYKGREFKQACFMTTEEAIDYIEWYGLNSGEDSNIDW